MTNSVPNNPQRLDKVQQGAMDMLMADAIQHGDADRIALVVSKGADPDALLRHAEFRGQQNYVRPALHLAYEMYNSKVFEAMLVAGAQVDIRDNDGLTVMMRAARDKNVDAVRLCLKYKANPLVKDNKDTALLTLARSSHTSTGEGISAKAILEMLLNALPDMRSHFNDNAPQQTAPEEATPTVALMPQIRLKKPAKAGSPNGFNLE